MAVLARTNAQLELVAGFLDAANMPNERRGPEHSPASDLLAPEQSARRFDEPERDAVALSTIHRAKGLEFQHVATIGWAEGLLPNYNATTPEQFAEEQRLAYVALSRAEDSLLITWSRGRNDPRYPDRAPSRFLAPVEKVVNELERRNAPLRGDARRARLAEIRCIPRTNLGRHGSNRRTTSEHDPRSSPARERPTRRRTSMNGAHALLETLTANDVTVCFANPGTSEMHFVAALDDAPEMRAVLCLFEGVATGAADGYARVTGTPAATLLHLGPGLANGWANLHNARRARVPLLNVVGDHATYHEDLDAPLQSNIESLASALEGWYRRSASPDLLASDVADAIASAYGPPGTIATLVVPADVSWGDLAEAPSPWPWAVRATTPTIDDATIDQAIGALRRKQCVVMLGDGALDKATLLLAQRVCAATSSRLMMETFVGVMDRGAGVASPERLIYVSEFAIDQLKDAEALILVGAREPVGFFAYPGVPSRLAAPGTEIIELLPPGGDARGALGELVERLNAPEVAVESGTRVDAPAGALTTQSFAAAIGATLPEGVIVADESNTSGVHLFEATRFAPEHRWMTLTGGAIGYGLPVALGAAVASKGRVLALESDGSMMYTLQALWSMAREGLDVTIVGLANRSYAVLEWELRRVGATSTGAASERLLVTRESDPRSRGAWRTPRASESVRATTADELVAALERSYATPGPSFIEAVLPGGRYLEANSPTTGAWSEGFSPLRALRST